MNTPGIRRALWSLFLVALAAIAVEWFVHFTFFVEPTDPLFGLLGFVFMCIGLVPLLGYLRQRSFRPRWLWRTYFWLGVLIAALQLAGIGIAVAKGESFGDVFWGAVGFVLMCAYATALQAYLYESPHLYSGTEPSREHNPT
jgi:hypothetical protein